MAVIRCVGRPQDLQVTVRGPLEGAGSWTHQYADPANTANSGDSLLQGQLGLLWFRDVDFDVPSRHGRGSRAPRLHQWRLFHEGLDGIVAVNAYNGRELWRVPLPNVLKPYDGDELMGVAGTGSNICLGGDRSLRAARSPLPAIGRRHRPADRPVPGSSCCRRCVCTVGLPGVVRRCAVRILGRPGTCRDIIVMSIGAAT